MTIRKAIVILIALVLAVTLTRDRIRSVGDAKGRSDSIAMRLEAEFALKASLAYRAQGMPQFAKQFETQAQTQLRKSSLGKHPDPASNLRLGILYGEQGSLTLAQAQFLIARERYEKQKSSDLVSRIRQTEALGRIYCGLVIPAAQVPRIISSLGSNPDWFRQVAIARAYRNAQLDKEANRIETRLENRAMTQIIELVLLLAVLFVGGMLGIAADIYLAIRWASGKLSGLQWTLGAWALFEAFVLWMLLQELLGHGVRRLSDGWAPSVIHQRALILLAALLLSDFILLLPPLGVVRAAARRVGGTLADIGFHLKDLGRNLAWGFGGYLGALPLLAVAVLVSSVLANQFFPSFQTPPNPAVGIILESKGLLARTLIFLLVAVAAPVVEETIFRGILYGAIRRRWGVAAGVIASSAIFALLHQQLPLGFLPIFTLGAVFAILYETRGSLVPGMIAHGLNNGFLFIMLLIVSS